MVLEKCSNILSDGGENSIEEKRDELSKLIDDYASEGNFLLVMNSQLLTTLKDFVLLHLPTRTFLKSQETKLATLSRILHSLVLLESRIQSEKRYRMPLRSARKLELLFA